VSTSSSDGHSVQAGTCRWRQPAIAATPPATRNQNWRWKVTTSTDPIAWKAAASRIGTIGG
jgi:hypothetical protein